ncbi:DUF2339 domain-containing protein [Brochothrix thermosphacta]|uniref:DUF2339 domain-containing protein n=1 Tax=Brochothrix thermosphacta TaxID=2756 RepID=UPI0039AFD335
MDKKLSVSERLAQVEQELAELKLQVKKNAASVSIEREVPRRTDEKNSLKERPAIQTKKVTVVQTPVQRRLAQQADSAKGHTTLTSTKVETLRNEEPLKKEPIKTTSIEAMIRKVLPKVFITMIIFGVLWGLKIVNDYGVFGFGLKLGIAYIISIATGVYAYRIYQKNSVFSSHLLFALSYIIGILTTAAGTFLYGAFSQGAGLSIALLYIMYGLLLAYYKRYQPLTIFIALTSLLLPYLLEYMAVSNNYIYAYVLLVFIALQWLTVSQSHVMAFIVNHLFSLLAVIFLNVANYGDNDTMGIITLMCLLILTAITWLGMNQRWGNSSSFHSGLIYSLLMVTFAVFILMAGFENLISHLILIIFFIAITAWSWKKVVPRVSDIYLVITLMTIITLVGYFTIDAAWMFIYTTCGFVFALLLAIRLQAPFLYATNGIGFFIYIYLVIFNTHRPVFTVLNLNVVLIIVGCYLIYSYLKKTTKLNSKATFSIINSNIAVLEWLPLVTIGLTYFFINQLSIISFNYPLYLIILLVTVVLLYDEKVRFGSLMTIFHLALAAFIYCRTLVSFTFGQSIWVFLLVGIGLLIVLSFLIYHVKQQRILEGHYGLQTPWDKRLSATILFGLMLLLALKLYMQTVYYYNGSQSILFMGQTLLIFVFAFYIMHWGLTEKVSVLRIAGFSLVILALFKLIFIDLWYLGLFVRSLLFIGMGGIGLGLTLKGNESRKSN